MLLAAYIATSAFCRSSSRAPCGRDRRDADAAVNDVPRGRASASGLRSARSSDSATTSLPRRSALSSSTANSSPPSRAAVSAGRTARCTRRPTSASTSSPTAWPSVSLIALKSSRSRNSTAAAPSPRASGGLDPLGEERAVRQPREDVVERLVAQPLLQIGHLGQRALEPSVLEHHARVADERLEQPPVVAAEGVDVPGAVADDDQAEDAVLAAERSDDRVRQLACGEVAVERVRGSGRWEQDRVRRRPRAAASTCCVGRAHDVGVGVHLALRAEGAPQPLLVTPPRRGRSPRTRPGRAAGRRRAAGRPRG